LPKKIPQRKGVLRKALQEGIETQLVRNKMQKDKRINESLKEIK
jgi:predicted membrane GTPase involved in stress response